MRWEWVGACGSCLTAFVGGFHLKINLALYWHHQSVMQQHKHPQPSRLENLSLLSEHLTFWFPKSIYSILCGEVPDMLRFDFSTCTWSQRPPAFVTSIHNQNNSNNNFSSGFMKVKRKYDMSDSNKSTTRNDPKTFTGYGLLNAIISFFFVSYVNMKCSIFGF